MIEGWEIYCLKFANSGPFPVQGNSEIDDKGTRNSEGRILFLFQANLSARVEHSS
jgi:hypothetical protein